MAEPEHIGSESESESEILPEFAARELTQRIIGAAYEVHNQLGYGFLESVYVKALVLELNRLNLEALTQVAIPVRYEGDEVGTFYADLLVEGAVICEIKATRDLVQEHEAQLLNYLKATGVRVGLLLNFGSSSVQVRRRVF